LLYELQFSGVNTLTKVTKQQILDELKRIAAPDGRGNIVSAGIVQDAVVTDEKVTVILNADPQRMGAMDKLKAVVEQAVAALPGVEKAMVILTAERHTGATQASQSAAPARSGPQRGLRVEGVKHLVAVASGKGGVGKSTTSINLALGLKAIGCSVAVLDADIYGPSMPKLFGLSGKPEAATAEGKKMMPMQRFGVEVSSIGFLVEEETAMIWRGPMVMSAIQQLIRDVQWSPADIMIIDLPPGTGDAQLTLVQQTAVSGAVIVSTPQDLALIDARKAITMFNKTNVPIIGMVENMSYFMCSTCGTRHDIFGHGGAEMEAARKAIPFLGAVPLDLDIRVRSDSGDPVGVSAPQSAHAVIYRDIAHKVWAAVENGQTEQAPPAISFE
jgi:ATP-binding protein involved in chromosome partitioning